MSDSSGPPDPLSGLAQEAGFWERILDTVADPVFVKDEQHRWVWHNKASCEMIGRPRHELLGKTDHDYFPKEEADVFHAKDAEVFATGKTNINEETFTDSGGVTYTIVTKKSVFEDAHGRKVLVGSVRDVTGQKRVEKALLEVQDELEARVERRTREMKRAQELLLHSQKMDAIGRLAGGIAHDFNNLMAVIAGSLELIHKGKLEDAARSELAMLALDAVQRGATLTSRMLAFSRQQALRPEPTDVSELLGDVEILLRRSLEASIVFSTDIVAPGLTTFVDRGQLEAALLNLCLNARDAMPAGGRLDVRVSAVEVGADALAMTDLVDGDYVLIEVRDDGPGMTPEVQARVFEPFFTTRGDAQGTGLGLSMVYGFAMQSQGAVTVTSQVGEGTTFSLYLPRAEPAVANDGPGETPLEAPRDQVVLVVDDEPHVLAVVTRSLSALGYTSHGAEGSDAALAFARRLPRVDVLLTDMILGHEQHGDVLAKQLLEIHPRARVLFMSGYPGERFVERVDHPLLQKPFGLTELARAVGALHREDAPADEAS